ncbi:MAG: tryptophan-rich sensory protein [Limnospira sp.]
MAPTEPSSPPDNIRRWATLLAIIAAFAVNIWTNIDPVNGLNVGEISNQFFEDVKIIPASYAFSIWGLIYLGLFALGIYQVLPGQRDNTHLDRMGYGLVWASLAQIVWIFLFLYRRFPLSLVAMAAILLSLIYSYLKLDVGRVRVPKWEAGFVNAPLSIYMGWISVATIVNVAIALYSLNWDGWGIAPQVWTAIVIIVAATIAIALRVRHRETAYPLVMIWALIAIAVGQNDPAIVTTAVMAALVVSLYGFGSTILRSSSVPESGEN